MSARYLVTADPGADQGAVEAGLRDAGAESVAPPAPELPDVFVVTVDESIGDYVERAQAVPGVQIAEPDAWAGFGDEQPETRDVGLMGVEEPDPQPLSGDER